MPQCVGKTRVLLDLYYRLLIYRGHVKLDKGQSVTFTIVKLQSQLALRGEVWGFSRQFLDENDGDISRAHCINCINTVVIAHTEVPQCLTSDTFVKAFVLPLASMKTLTSSMYLKLRPWILTWLSITVISSDLSIQAMGHRIQFTRTHIQVTQIPATQHKQDHPKYGLSQWRTMLHCNGVSQWLKLYSERSPLYHTFKRINLNQVTLQWGEFITRTTPRGIWVAKMTRPTTRNQIPYCRDQGRSYFIYCQISNISLTKPQNFLFLGSSCMCLCTK